MPPVFVLAGLGISLVLVAWLFRRRWLPWWHEPIVTKRWHLYVGALTGSLAIVVALGFNFQQREANARQDAAARAALAARILDRQEIASIAQAQAILLRPSNAERNRRNLVALKSCVRSGECRKLLTTIVVRTLEPTMVPGAKGSRPVKTIVIRGKQGPVGPQGAQGVPGAAGSAGRDGVGKTGAPGKPGGPGTVDSNVVDGLDNRVAGLESALQAVVSRVQVLDRLVALLCRILTPGKC
jgi:hypothetical protein